MIQKLGIWQGGCANFLSGASDHCASYTARVKTKNVLHSQRSQKTTFESFSVYEVGEFADAKGGRFASDPARVTIRN